MLVKGVLLLLITVVMTFFVSMSFAEPVIIKLAFEPDLKNGQHIYETCASCHLPEGWGNSDGAYPQIAGQHQNVLIQQLLDIRSGKRENPTMYPFVQERTIGGYQSLADVVVYISTLPMHPQHRKGPWRDYTEEYKTGEKLYKQNCASCHGGHGEGNNETTTPKLYGQHYPYIKRQIILVKSGLRTVNSAMQAVAQKLTDDQLEQIINYISYLSVPEDERAPSLNWRNTDFN